MAATGSECQSQNTHFSECVSYHFHYHLRIFLNLQSQSESIKWLVASMQAWVKHFHKVPSQSPLTPKSETESSCVVSRRFLAGHDVFLANILEVVCIAFISEYFPYFLLYFPVLPTLLDLLRISEFWKDNPIQHWVFEKGRIITEP